MDICKENIKDDYFMALNGREYWLQLKKKYEFKSEDGLILCDIEDLEWQQEIVKWLPEFAKRKYFPQTLFFSTMKLPIATWKGNNFLKCIVIEKKTMECLLKYYRLTQFTKYIYVISLEPPFGNDFMIGHKGITIQDWLRNFG